MKIRSAVVAVALSFAMFASYLAPVALFGLVVTQTACPKSDSIASVADEIAKDIDAALPVFEANGQNTAKLILARDYAVKIRDAFKAGNTTTATETVALLISVFDTEIVAQINAVSNPTVRTVLFVALVLGRRHLATLADKIAEAAPESARRSNSRAVATIAEFRARKQWRCRDSVSGRYAKMDYCKANPSTTTVETR